MVEPTGTWLPTDYDLATAQVTALADALGVPDYDTLVALSLADPARYWDRVIEFVGLIWSTPPTAYVDLERGPEFPRWFPGGSLNWVTSVLRFAQDPRVVDRPAIVAEREDGSTATLTYRELDISVRRFAAGLHAKGVCRGDCVGLLMENGVEATVTMLALAYLGAIVVPLFSGFGTDAVISRLESCGARALVATDGFDRRGRRVDTGSTVRDVLTTLPGIELLVIKGNGSDPDFVDGVSWHSLVEDNYAEVPPAEMTADDPFMVIFTSGTTGKPKGVVHTHGGFPLKIAHDAAVHFNLAPGDTLCWPADMGWIAGSLVLASALLRGATLVCYDGAPNFPDWSRMSRLIERHGITHLGSAPTLIRGLAAHGAEATLGDLLSLRLLITAGEGIDPEHFEWFQRHFGNARCPLINYTGGTEVSGALLSSVVVRPIAPGAFNTTSPGVDVRVVDNAGKGVTDEVGELAVAAPFVGMTHSFWEDDERYLETYWRSVPGLWVHGDLAIHRSSNDYLMVGRSDDTIKVAGKRLGPAEVEEIVIALPEVSEAAAIGVPDDLKGERVVIFVVLAKTDVDEEVLCARVRDRVGSALGKAFLPSAVHVVTALPKTRSTKVMRRAIRSVYCDQPAGDLSALDDPATLDLIKIASDRARK